MFPDAFQLPMDRLYNLRGCLPKLFVLIALCTYARRASAQCPDPGACPPDLFEPLCGSDMITYVNDCEFTIAQCANTTLTVVGSEPCEVMDARGLFDDDDSMGSDDDDSTELLLLLLLLPLLCCLLKCCCCRNQGGCCCMPNYCCC